MIFLVLLSDIVLDSSQSFFLDRMRLKMETPIKVHRRGVTRKSVGCGERCVGSGVLMVRAPACREDGGSFPPPPFRSLGNFVHPTLPVSEETLKAVGPNSCVSSILGCLEYNYLRLKSQ